METVLGTAFAPQFVILYVYVLSAIWVHYRGQDRHRFLRQLSDHSTLMAPINCFMYAFSAVPGRPFVPTGSFPELAALRENWQTIRDEAIALYRQGRITTSQKYDDIGFNSFFRRGWTRFYLKWYGDFLPSAATACPQTIELLKKTPSVHAAMFAVLPAGGTLGRHRDPYAGSLRYHLGLATPNSDSSRIYVDGTSYSWRDGQDVLFDETYLHHAVNDSDQDRIILFCDVERPMNNAIARTINHFFAVTLMRAAAARNHESETVGVLNRIFGVVYPLRAKLKRLKKNNRRAYYAVKWSINGTLLAILLGTVALRFL